MSALITEIDLGLGDWGIGVLAHAMVQKAGIDLVRKERPWDDWGYWRKVYCPIEDPFQEHRLAETVQYRQGQYHCLTYVGYAPMHQALNWCPLFPTYRGQGLHDLDPGVWTSADRGWRARVTGRLSQAESHRLCQPRVMEVLS